MNIKLIIWDLDDTLWRGTLAEQENVELNTERADMLKAFAGHGIVSAICSKNDPVVAREKLVEFGLWESLVFCRIDFVPKGEAVQHLISDMQLRPENTLFVDDNAVNLAEVSQFNPGIHILDASTPACDATLQKILADNIHVTKYRVEEYRLLEARLASERSISQSREDFLRSCNIRLCLLPRGDNLEFSARLEELVNRTNQLNYCKTRVEPGSMPQYLSRTLDVECYSVAAWDKFGYYGIVGFAAVENWKRLKHFAFSCRIMHMGIEQWLLAKLCSRFTELDFSRIDIKPEISPWLKEIAYTGAARSEIRNRELHEEQRVVKLRVMASCQSGAITHFSGLNAIAEFDNAPRQFELSQVLDGAYKQQQFPPNLVYGAFTDYATPYWPKPLTSDLYENCAAEFAGFVAELGARLLVILPPCNLPNRLFRPDYGMTRERIETFNNVWQNLSLRHEHLGLLRIDDIATDGDIIDCRHFDVPLLNKIGTKVAHWMTFSGEANIHRHKREDMNADGQYV